MIMDVVEKKSKLKEIINKCKGIYTINQFLDMCSINPVIFRNTLNENTDYFGLDKVTIQKILTNTDNSLNKTDVENDLYSLIETKDKSLYITRGQIYWVDFGNDGVGSEQKYTRPALVMQNNIGNKNAPTVVVVAVTSNINKTKLPVHVLIENLENCGLSEDSIVLTEQIKTVDKSRVKGYIGECPYGLMRKIDRAFKIEYGVYNPIDIRKFVEQFSNDINASDKFRLKLAIEMEKFFIDNNHDYVENIQTYITQMKRIFISERDRVKVKDLVCAV
jgi:mRNA interferase MazF